MTGWDFCRTSTGAFPTLALATGGVLSGRKSRNLESLRLLVESYRDCLGIPRITPVCVIFSLPQGSKDFLHPSYDGPASRRTFILALEVLQPFYLIQGTPFSFTMEMETPKSYAIDRISSDHADDGFELRSRSKFGELRGTIADEKEMRDLGRTQVLNVRSLCSLWRGKMLIIVEELSFHLDIRIRLHSYEHMGDRINVCAQC
jgi:hypothetical protein